MISNVRNTSEVAKAGKPRKLSVLKNMNESLILVDEKEGICILRWNGRVDIETASELLTLGSAAVMLKGYKRMLIDRRRLLEFDNEARLWIDKWIKTKAKSISYGIEKVAIINSDSTFGNIFNNAFNSTIALVMPHLNIKKFSNDVKAMEWLSR